MSQQTSNIYFEHYSLLEIVNLYRYSEDFTNLNISRNYRWSAPIVQAFLNDLSQIISNNYTSHYMGSVLLEARPQNRRHEYKIFDGQQRVLTAVIMARVLHHKILRIAQSLYADDISVDSSRLKYVAPQKLGLSKAQEISTFNKLSAYVPHMVDRISFHNEEQHEIFYNLETLCENLDGLSEQDHAFFINNDLVAAYLEAKAYFNKYADHAAAHTAERLREKQQLSDSEIFKRCQFARVKIFLYYFQALEQCLVNATVLHTNNNYRFINDIFTKTNEMSSFERLGAALLSGISDQCRYAIGENVDQVRALVGGIMSGQHHVNVNSIDEECGVFLEQVLDIILRNYNAYEPLTRASFNDKCYIYQRLLRKELESHLPHFLALCSIQREVDTNIVPTEHSENISLLRPIVAKELRINEQTGEQVIEYVRKSTLDLRLNGFAIEKLNFDAEKLRPLLEAELMPDGLTLNPINYEAETYMIWEMALPWARAFNLIKYAHQHRQYETPFFKAYPDIIKKIEQIRDLNIASIDDYLLYTTHGLLTQEVNVIEYAQMLDLTYNFLLRHLVMGRNPDNINFLVDDVISWRIKSPAVLEFFLAEVLSEQDCLVDDTTYVKHLLQLSLQENYLTELYVELLNCKDSLQFLQTKITSSLSIILQAANPVQALQEQPKLLSELQKLVYSFAQVVTRDLVLYEFAELHNISEQTFSAEFFVDTATKIIENYANRPNANYRIDYAQRRLYESFKIVDLPQQLHSKAVADSKVNYMQGLISEFFPDNAVTSANYMRKWEQAQQELAVKNNPTWELPTSENEQQVLELVDRNAQAQRVNSLLASSTNFSFTRYARRTNTPAILNSRNSLGSGVITMNNLSLNAPNLIINPALVSEMTGTSLADQERRSYRNIIHQVANLVDQRYKQQEANTIPTPDAITDKVINGSGLDIMVEVKSSRREDKNQATIITKDGEELSHADFDAASMQERGIAVNGSTGAAAHELVSIDRNATLEVQRYNSTAYTGVNITTAPNEEQVQLKNKAAALVQAKKQADKVSKELAQQANASLRAKTSSVTGLTISTSVENVRDAANEVTAVTKSTQESIVTKVEQLHVSASSTVAQDVGKEKKAVNEKSTENNKQNKSSVTPKTTANSKQTVSSSTRLDEQEQVEQDSSHHKQSAASKQEVQATSSQKQKKDFIADKSAAQFIDSSPAAASLALATESSAEENDIDDEEEYRLYLAKQNQDLAGVNSTQVHNVLSSIYTRTGEDLSLVASHLDSTATTDAQQAAVNLDANATIDDKVSSLAETNALKAEVDAARCQARAYDTEQRNANFDFTTKEELENLESILFKGKVSTAQTQASAESKLEIAGNETPSSSVDTAKAAQGDENKFTDTQTSAEQSKTPVISLQQAYQYGSQKAIAVDQSYEQEDQLINQDIRTVFGIRPQSENTVEEPPVVPKVNPYVADISSFAPGATNNPNAIFEVMQTSKEKTEVAEGTKQESLAESQVNYASQALTPDQALADKVAKVRASQMGVPLAPPSILEATSLDLINADLQASELPNFVPALNLEGQDKAKESPYSLDKDSTQEEVVPKGQNSKGNKGLTLNDSGYGKSILPPNFDPKLANTKADLELRPLKDKDTFQLHVGAPLTHEPSQEQTKADKVLANVAVAKALQEKRALEVEQENQASLETQAAAKALAAKAFTTGQDLTAKHEGEKIPNRVKVALDSYEPAAKHKELSNTAAATTAVGQEQVPAIVVHKSKSFGFKVEDGSELVTKNQENKQARHFAEAELLAAAEKAARAAFPKALQTVLTATESLQQGLAAKNKIKPIAAPKVKRLELNNLNANLSAQIPAQAEKEIGGNSSQAIDHRVVDDERKGITTLEPAVVEAINQTVLLGQEQDSLVELKPRTSVNTVTSQQDVSESQQNHANEVALESANHLPTTLDAEKRAETAVVATNASETSVDLTSVEPTSGSIEQQVDFVLEVSGSTQETNAIELANAQEHSREETTSWNKQATTPSAEMVGETAAQEEQELAVQSTTTPVLDSEDGDKIALEQVHTVETVVDSDSAITNQVIQTTAATVVPESTDLSSEITTESQAVTEQFITEVESNKQAIEQDEVQIATQAATQNLNAHETIEDTSQEAKQELSRSNNEQSNVVPTEPEDLAAEFAEIESNLPYFDDEEDDEDFAPIQYSTYSEEEVDNDWDEEPVVKSNNDKLLQDLSAQNILQNQLSGKFGRKRSGRSVKEDVVHVGQKSLTANHRNLSRGANIPLTTTPRVNQPTAVLNSTLENPLGAITQLSLDLDAPTVISRVPQRTPTTLGSASNSLGLNSHHSVKESISANSGIKANDSSMSPTRLVTNATTIKPSPFANKLAHALEVEGETQEINESVVEKTLSQHEISQQQSNLSENKDDSIVKIQGQRQVATELQYKQATSAKANNNAYQQQAYNIASFDIPEGLWLPTEELDIRYVSKIMQADKHVLNHQVPVAQVILTGVCNYFVSQGLDIGLEIGDEIINVYCEQRLVMQIQLSRSVPAFIFDPTLFIGLAGLLVNEQDYQNPLYANFNKRLIVNKVPKIDALFIVLQQMFGENKEVKQQVMAQVRALGNSKKG